MNLFGPFVSGALGVCVGVAFGWRGVVAMTLTAVVYIAILWIRHQRSSDWCDEGRVRLKP